MRDEMSLVKLSTLVQNLPKAQYIGLILTLLAVGLGFFARGLSTFVGILAYRDAEENFAWMPYSSSVPELGLFGDAPVLAGRWTLLASSAILNEICKSNGARVNSIAVPVVSLNVGKQSESAQSRDAQSACDVTQFVSVLVDSAFLKQSSVLAPQGFALLDPNRHVTYSSRRAHDILHITRAGKFLMGSIAPEDSL